MRFSIVNIDTCRSSKDKIRLCFWIYLLLLIFEGAFRKWFLPGLSDIFLIIRDPVALYVIALGIEHNLVKNKVVYVLFLVSIISFVLTLILGHHNLFVAIYGLRIIMLHVPCIFIFGVSLTNVDLLLIGKTVLRISVLMFLIILVQYFSPPTAWINSGVGGVGTSTFQGVGEYHRPSGTFSFTSGMAGFEMLTAVFIFYFLYSNYRLKERFKVHVIEMSVFVITFLFSIILCLSRTVIFQTLLLFFMIILYPSLFEKKVSKSLYLIILTLVLAFILYQIDSFKIAYDNMLLRFEQASKVEGDVVDGTLGERFFGSFYRAFFNTQNFSGQEIPLFGFGLGIGTKVGEQILNIQSTGHSFAFAEEEWSRIICEMGLLQGGVLLLGIRLLYPIYLVSMAMKYIWVQKDVFLFLSSASFLLYFVKNQWAVPTNLGFTVVICSLFMVAYNQCRYKKNKNIHQTDILRR